jgi:type IV secretory pathway TraG/TraD family ATPase VirD4
MRLPNRLPEPGTREVGPIAFLAVTVFGAGVVGAAWLAAAGGAALSGRTAPGSLAAFFSAAMSGDVYWAGGESAILAAVAVLLAVGVGAGWVAARKLLRGRTRVDTKAKFMATAADMALLAPNGAQRDAERLGAAHAGPGVPLGTSVRTGQALRASWEWVQLYIMGPRAGKTTCVCIPQILETTGPVLVTSNKRDVVDLSRGPRSMQGLVWVHDVQGLIGEKPTWWWDPLSYVTNVETADELADLFITSATSAGARQDAYFASAGRQVLSSMLLAAAVGGRPVTDVLTWLYDVKDETPLELLTARGEQFTTTVLEGNMELTDRQRDGVYGTARPWIDFLRNETLLPWITRQGTEDNRPQFDPYAFAKSTDTIYLISREGAGSARAMTGALTMATLKAAEAVASRHGGGRLATPLVAVLDEAANVCRWRDLPDLYSHYGSRGIILSTFLQSWAQGSAAWGEDGMQKLWSAANVRVVGPGVAQDAFLRSVSELIGDYDVHSRSASRGRGETSTSTTVNRRRLFEIAEVAAMPAARAVMSSTGMPAILLKLDHYSTKGYAAMASESKRYYEDLATTAGAVVPSPTTSPFITPPVPAIVPARSAVDDQIPGDLVSAVPFGSSRGMSR